MTEDRAYDVELVDAQGHVLARGCADLCKQEFRVSWPGAIPLQAGQRYVIKIYWDAPAIPVPAIPDEDGTDVATNYAGSGTNQLG